MQHTLWVISRDVSGKEGTGLDNDKHPTAMRNDYSLPVPTKRDSDIISLANFIAQERYINLLISYFVIIIHYV